jgi:DNA invertase Pin-like site-specific DNA recombinase
MSEKKKAFLYGRVSTTAQAESGHGLDRQLKSALKFLEDYPEYEVDNSNIIQDKGVSAYSGDNIADSAGLGGFLTAVRQGIIPRDSLLVIEAPDRLSRLGIRKGQRLFDEFADHGINVGLVRYGTIIRHDDDNDFQNSLIVSIGLYLGHLESQQKSERIRDTMGKRRDAMRTGEIKSTTHRPSWLDPKEDGTGFEFNAFAEVVRLMFELRLKGLGGHKIAKWLNEKGYTDAEGRQIRFQRVAHYLRSKAAIGYYQPHKVTKVKGKRLNEPSGEPITDFYPRLVSEEDFYEVQRLLDSSSGGRRDQFTNYLRDLVKCELCSHNFTTVAVKGRNN